MYRKIISELFEEYIKNTPKGADVVNKTTFLCRLTKAVKEAGEFPTTKVYIKTRVIKHLYDKKTAEEFFFIVENLHKIAKYPDHIYINKGSKRGDFAFLKRLKGKICFCSLEIIEKKEEKFQGNYIVTTYDLRTEEKAKRYLKNYKPLWSWRDDTPSS